jgi:acetate kinase
LWHTLYLVTTSRFPTVEWPERAQLRVGAFAAVLGGLDTLVFAGGIGENAPTVRSRICAGLGFLSIELDEKRNAANDGVVSAASSRVEVRVIRTDEEQMIAQLTCRVVGLALKKEN